MLRILTLIVATILPGAAAAQNGSEPPLAPELTGGLGWLNVDKPVSLRELRGNVVLLDFWTAGCVNCMHMLAVLDALETRRDGQPVQIIGVHSAKFDSEKDPTRVLAAVERYGIRHPVVVDRDMAIWERYGVQAWPTLIVVRPDGRIAGAIPGEISLDALDTIVGRVLDEARADGTLAPGPLLAHRSPHHEGGTLSFPGKVLAADDGRLFISDTGHHRVLITSPGGRVLDIIGSGASGVGDGPFTSARFVEPQGLAYDPAHQRLFVADARGQRVAVADLHRKTVTTLAGTGELGTSPVGPDSRPAREVALRTPWDLALHGDTLYVALAGSHQLAAIDLRPGLSAATLRRFAGTGREALRDGLPDESAFAQPSGLSIQGDVMFVADSEASAIRKVDLVSGSTSTLLGTGLFDWGDGDGVLRPRLLQHPVAVAVAPGGLWIADTYNRKIKWLTLGPDPAANTLRTVVVAAAGQPLGNPSGLAVESDGSLVIADTDRSRLLRLPPRSSEAMVIAITQGGATPIVTAPGASPATPRSHVEELTVASRRLQPGRHELALQLLAPEGFAFSEGAPWSVELTVEGDGVHIVDTHRDGEASGGTTVDLTAGIDAKAKATLVASVRATVCDSVNHAACYPRRLRYRVPVQVDGGAHAAPLVLALTAPAVGTTSTR
jgi:DNA-binding beta-propeller fold protein YncE